MATSPVTENTDLVNFSILSNGTEIPVAYQVVSLKIKQQLNGAAIAEVIFLDGDLAAGTFPISSSDTFKPGATIVIKLGYQGTNETIFSGQVGSHAVIANSKGSTLKIICKTAVVNENIVNLAAAASPLKLEYGVDIIEMDLEFDAAYPPLNASRFRGFIRFQGSANAMINSTIEIDGLGNKFNEPVLISQVEHLVENGNWVTIITIGVAP
jgi:phage protein D